MSQIGSLYRKYEVLRQHKISCYEA